MSNTYMLFCSINNNMTISLFTSIQELGEALGYCNLIEKHELITLDDEYEFCFEERVAVFDDEEDGCGSSELEDFNNAMHISNYNINTQTWVDIKERGWSYLENGDVEVTVHLNKVSEYSDLYGAAQEIHN